MLANRLLASGLVVLSLAPSIATGQATRRVSVASNGVHGLGPSERTAISAGGRFVAFDSSANLHVPGSPSGLSLIFVHDLETRVTTCESVSSSGIACGPSYWPSISADGQVVAFNSLSPVLSGGPLSSRVYVRDRVTLQTWCVSVSSSGAVGGGSSNEPSLSADGRYVAFGSTASNLVTGDSNGVTDVFLHDRMLGTTERVSVSSSGSQGNGASSQAAVSADGRFVAFASAAATLVAGDGNGKSDIFVRDRLVGSTVRASVGVGGLQGDQHSFTPSISANGRWVAFISEATNLIPSDTNFAMDVFVRDIQAGTTSRASVSSAGAQANNWSDTPSIAADGSSVAFLSAASNLIGGDSNSRVDVFIRNLVTNATIRSSVSSSGLEANGENSWPSLSGDGSVIAFSSASNNLIFGDSNGAPDVFERGWVAACYPDHDFDGFGAGSPTFFSAAECGLGFSTYATDCNDNDPSIHPARPEVCNGVDDDCDGSVNEGFATATYFYDADGDGFGNSSTTVVWCSPPPGYAQVGQDCDDTRIDVFPGAPELCDGLDNDCNGTIDDGFLATYCTAGTTVQGCVPSIGGDGVPSSISGSGFDIVVESVPTQRVGLIFYGLSPTGQSWALGSSSYLCIFYPVLRTGAQNSGGSVGACDGELRVDFNAFVAANPNALGSPFAPGSIFYAQGWFRDPGAAKQTNLSNGLRFTLCN